MYYEWSDGTDVTYTNWNINEPNNSGDEDCVEVASVRIGYCHRYRKEITVAGHFLFSPLGEIWGEIGNVWEFTRKRSKCCMSNLYRVSFQFRVGRDVCKRVD